MGTKGRLMGEARRSQVDQGAMWERWNLPSILLGPPKGREMSDLQDSAFSWETWRLWRTHMHLKFLTHIDWEKWKSYQKSDAFMCFTVPEKTNWWNSHTERYTHTDTHTLAHTHTQAYSNLYREIFHQKYGCDTWHAGNTWLYRCTIAHIHKQWQITRFTLWWENDDRHTDTHMQVMYIIFNLIYAHTVCGWNLLRA